MGAMPIGCYKQMSAIKEGVIMRLQCIFKYAFCTLMLRQGKKLNIFSREGRHFRGSHIFNFPPENVKCRKVT